MTGYRLKCQSYVSLSFLFPSILVLTSLCQFYICQSHISLLILCKPIFILWISVNIMLVNHRFLDQSSVCQSYISLLILCKPIFILWVSVNIMFVNHRFLDQSSVWQSYLSVNHVSGNLMFLSILHLTTFLHLYQSYIYGNIDSLSILYHSIDQVSANPMYFCHDLFVNLMSPYKFYISLSILHLSDNHVFLYPSYVSVNHISVNLMYLCQSCLLIGYPHRTIS